MSTHGNRETPRGWKSIPCYRCGDPESRHELCEPSYRSGTPYCSRSNGHSMSERHKCQVRNCRCEQYAGIQDREPEGVVR